MIRIAWRAAGPRIGPAPALPRVAFRPPAGAGPLAAAIGPQGPPGPSGAGLEVALSPAATVHAVAHNLGRRPAVEVRTTGGLVVEADIAHLSLDVLEVRTVAPFAGFAYLS